jgi:hypothetical protein
MYVIIKMNLIFLSEIKDNNMNNQVIDMPADKYECSCGSIIKNVPKNVKAHEKSLKHMNFLEGKLLVPSSSSAANVRKFREKKRLELGEEEFKKQQRQAQAMRRAQKKIKEPIVEEVKEEVKEELKEEEKKEKKLVKVSKKQVVKVSKKEGQNKTNSLPKVQLNSDCELNVDQMYQSAVDFAKAEGNPNVKVNNKKVVVEKASLMKYHKTIHRFYERFYKKELVDCSDMSWLKKDLSKFGSFVLSWVRDNARDPKNFQNSLTSTINDIVSYLKRLQGYDREYDFLSRLLKANVKMRELQLKKNEPTKLQQERLISLDKLKSFSSVADTLEPKTRLLYYLYTWFPRRLQDYRLMRVAKLNKRVNTINKLQSSQGYDENSNYVVKNSNGVPYKLIFNIYKKSVKDILGTQIFEIPAELRKVLKEYIDQENIKDGELLFSNQKGEYTTMEFSKAISKAFQAITGIPISMGDARHIQATHYASKNLSMAKLDEKAKEMAQSNWTTFYSYAKFNPDDVLE